jgi:putative transcriptional regulator
MISPIQPRNGSLLVSEPFMIDPNFKRSVVLLTEFEIQGAIGFVLNQKSNLLLSDLISDLKSADFPIFIGGPVENDSLHFLHRCYDKIKSGTQIREGLFWGGNFEALKILLQNNMLNHDEIKFFIGYSGWEAGQLENEMKENSWMVTDKFDSEVVFVDDEENLWREVIIGLGPKYAHIANFPENPRWN